MVKILINQHKEPDSSHCGGPSIIIGSSTLLNMTTEDTLTTEKTRTQHNARSSEA